MKVMRDGEQFCKQLLKIFAHDFKDKRNLETVFLGHRKTNERCKF